jgi:anti-sigma-K factor RskA
MTHDELHDLAGVYALDALDVAERERFEAHLAGCATCRDEVDELREVTADLAGLVTQAPPAGLRERVLAEVDRTPQAPAPDGPEPAASDDAGATPPSGPRRSFSSTVVGMAAGIVLVLALGVSALVVSLLDRIGELEVAAEQMTEILAAPDARTVSAHGPDGSLARVVLAPSRGEAMFLAQGMDPAPVDHEYELWLIDEEGAHSIGLLDLDEGGRAVHRLDGEMETAVAVGITVEPEGGSPEPTTDPVMLLELADA